MRSSIDKLINRVLEEEIQKKVQQFLNEDRSEWMEIDGTIDEIDEEYVDEDENLESREFVYAARKAKEQGKKTFELDGKKFDVKEKLERLHKGLHGVSESKLTQMKNDILSKKTITLKEQNILEQINSALDLKKMNSQNNKLRISESELLDLIESIVLEKKSEKWIQKTEMEKGALHKKMGVPKDEKIPVSDLKKKKSELQKKAEGDKKLSAADLKLLKQINLALNLKSMKESQDVKDLTEEELTNVIRKIVTNQINEVSDLDNMDKKIPFGLTKTQKVQKETKKENDDYAEEVMKKMREYLKDGSKGDFSTNPEDFPKSNYQLDKDAKIMKYNPSEAVDEYIDAFAYPGMTNLVYDEIKPDDEKIDKYLKGDVTTGNAVRDKDGKALGNVVPSKVGDKFKKNFDENLYGAEQMNVSYKRQPQPVDIAGDKKDSGSLSTKRSSINKDQKIMNQLESKENKESRIINEEMEKMKKLIQYNKRTQ